MGHVDLAQDEHRGPLAVARRQEAAHLRVLTVTSAIDDPDVVADASSQHGVAEDGDAAAAPARGLAGVAGVAS